MQLYVVYCSFQKFHFLEIAEKLPEGWVHSYVVFGVNSKICLFSLDKCVATPN